VFNCFFFVFNFCSRDLAVVVAISLEVSELVVVHGLYFLKERLLHRRRLYRGEFSTGGK
jgi:hypothetical protein